MTILDKYAQKKVQIKKLNEEIEEMKPDVLVALEEIDPDNQGVEHALGVYYRSNIKSWVFSDNVENLKTELDKLKKEEKRDGTATFHQVESINFREKQ